MVYIAKPYFETILQEAAKDHYPYLKRAFKHVVGKVFGQEPEKRKLEVSHVLSLYAETAEGQRVKFLLEEGLSGDIYEECFDAAHQLLIENHMNHPDDDLTKQIHTVQPKFGYIVLHYRKEENTWFVIDPVSEAIKKKSDE